MPVSLKNVLDNILQVLNFIKSSPLSVNIFNIPCDEMESSSSPFAVFQSTMVASRNSIMQAELAAFVWN